MNQENRKPENFDWVTARAQCSAGKFFERLRHQVKKDVEVRNASNPTKHYIFIFAESESDCFSVSVEGHYINYDAVRFNLGADKISITSMDGMQIEVSITLGEDGDCRARIAGREYDLWQVRKMALESLFFRAY